jgi:hypothetical protein
MQLVLRFGYFQFENVTLALNGNIFLLLSSVCIAAGGCLINAIF